MASIFTGTVTAASYGGGWPWGHPSLLVVHDVESPLGNGYAYSLAQYFGRPKSAGGPGTSAHAIAGPDGLWKLVLETNVSWNCGPNGNAITFAIEQCGYAKFTRSEWTTVLGLKQLERVAQWLAWGARLHGIPLRWCSYADIRTAYNTGKRMGVCTHDDISNAIGGTDHWDPGLNYPKDLLMRRAIEIYNGIVIPKEWDDLATKAEVQAAAKAGADAAVKVVLDELATAVTALYGTVFWGTHLVGTGRVHANSRFARDSFLNNDMIITAVNELKGKGNTQVLAALTELAKPPPDELSYWQYTSLTEEQLGNAQVVITTAKNLGLTPRDGAIGVTTAMTESSLKSGEQNPNDGTTSIGLFQQKAEWYPDIDRLDPVQSSTAFYNQLKGINGRESIPMHVCAQTIQRSQFTTGINYAVWTELGILLSESMWNTD